MRTLVPEGLEPIALSNWLDKNAALLTRPKAPNLNPGEGEGGAGGPADGKQIELTEGELLYIKKANLTQKQYAEIKARRAGQPKTPPK